MNKAIGKMPVVFLLFLTGCSSFDGSAIRESHTKEYQQLLTEKTEEMLSEKEPLDLNDCVEIALNNNLNIRSSRIQEQIATLERKVAFSNFLPAVNLDYQYTRWDTQPKIKFGSSAVAMHDEKIREITWKIQTSIFDPSTWFLYAMHQRGEEIAELVTKYTRQMTILEVTVNYYHCLALEQAERALQSQLNAAVGLEKEISAFYEEGLATEWQFKQAQVFVLERNTSLHNMQYALGQAKADLLASIGLSPLADISLDTTNPVNPPNESLEDLVVETLVSNPQLQIADRKIAVEKEKVKVALAGFLPRLAGFASRTHSSDSFLLYDNYWTYGLAGTMTLFNGFANINEYKAAKERQKQAFTEREQQTIVLMLEVLKAHLNLENAKEQSLLAQKAYDASSRHLIEVEEKWREGLVESSEMLDILAERDNAQMEAMNSRFHLQVSIATLNNAMGITDKDYEEGKYEDNVAKNNCTTIK